MGTGGLFLKGKRLWAELDGDGSLPPPLIPKPCVALRARLVSCFLFELRGSLQDGNCLLLEGNAVNSL